MTFSALKKGTKVVDRWYSYYPNSFGISGQGKIIKISRKHKTAQIQFGENILTYDVDHINEFIVPWKPRMAQKYQGKIIPKN